MDVVQVHAASDFIERVNGLVRQMAVGDVPGSQLHARIDGFIGVGYAVVLLVFILDVVQNLDGLLHGGGFHNHLLETPLQRTIFLNVLAVFIEGGRTDALDFSTGQSRFEHVARIE